MPLEQSLKHNRIGGTQSQGLSKHLNGIVERAFGQQMVTCFSEGSRCFRHQIFFKVPFSELDAQSSIRRIEVGNLAQYLEPCLSRTGPIVSIGDGQIVSPRFDDKILLRVEVSEVG